MLVSMLFSLALAGCPFSSSGSCPEEPVSLLQLRLEGATCPNAETTLPTCGAELEVRRSLADQFANKTLAREGPQFVRMVFHDAIDHNNLKQNDELDGAEVTRAVAGGGVDACLYSTSTPSGVPDQSHNRNLPGVTLGMLQRKFGCAASQPDVEVLAASVAVEQAGGPRLPMRWGRSKGRCARLVDCPFKGGGCASNLTIDVAPVATSFDAGAWRAAFQLHGFTADEQVALMGAHTYGKLQVCAGGFNGIERGASCKKGERCVKNGAFDLKETSRGAVPLDGGKAGFGDGGVFDLTPQIFDNNYFALMQDEAPDGDQQCCGKLKWGQCHRGAGSPARLDRQPSADLCDVGFCRSDRKGRSHMKSTRYFVKPDASFVKKAQHHGQVKRVIRLGADWALLKRPDTRAAVRRFAADQPAFFAAFASAFGKLADFGAGALASCAPEACEDAPEGWACGGQTFHADALDCPRAERCQLVGGVGAKGVLECAGATLICCAGAPCS